ncbi:MAG: hypothetical protein NPIRA06_03060 [Nitrospirales bacterium]|nr:MAG: hypothetical protein NPIRA06_03060 [Nitrospirales bacterium]
MSNANSAVDCPPSIKQLDEIVSEMEKALSTSGALLPIFRPLLHEATMELSSVLGMIYGGRVGNPEILEKRLRKANKYLGNEIIAKSTKLMEFSSKARLVIDAAIREIYKLNQPHDLDPRNPSRVEHFEHTHS